MISLAILTIYLFCFFRCRHDVKGSISETLDEDEEILGSDDDEQEDPRDYTKGTVEREISTHKKKASKD